MFSVIIPLFNKELSIKSTIDSVLQQTFDNFEVVVINDGSTDSSVKIIECIDDDRIRLIHQPNQGVSAARNCGIKEARHKWVAFLDGDDLWKPNHLEEITKMMALFPSERIYVTSYIFSDNRALFKHFRKSEIFKIENYFEVAIKESVMSSSNVVIFKDCFNKVGGFNICLNRGEDLDMWARLAREYKIVKSKAVTAIYRVDAENRTSITSDLEKTHVYYFCLKDSLSFHEKEYYKNVLLNRLYNYLRLCHFKSFIRLKNKFPEITYIELASFFSGRIKSRAMERVKKWL